MRAIMFNCPQPSSPFKKAIKSTGSNPEKGGKKKEKTRGKIKKTSLSPPSSLPLQPLSMFRLCGGRDAATALL